MNPTERLHHAVNAFCKATVTMGDINDKSTWWITFDPGNTPEQRAAGQAALEAFDPNAPEVPASVTRLQAMLALRQFGMLDQVTAAVTQAGPTSDAGLYWVNAMTWERNNPVLLSMAQQLGITDQLDALFIAAGQH